MIVLNPNRHTNNQILILVLTLMMVSCFQVFVLPYLHINKNVHTRPSFNPFNKIKRTTNYNINETPINKSVELILSQIKTFGNFDAFQCKPMVHCPEKGIVTVMCGGELENFLWQYAIVWVIAEKTGLKPFIPTCTKNALEQIFQPLAIPTLQEISQCPISFEKFVFSLNAWKNINENILLSQFTILPELITQWIQNLRKQFQFQKQLIINSQLVLQTAKTITNYDKFNSVIFVGVFIKRKEYHKKLSHLNVNFYYSAMNYFEKKYKNVIFIVTSDDLKWCFKNLKQRKNIYIIDERYSPAQNLALLAACNHTVFNYGNFGIWGAILAGGETIVNNLKNQSSVTFTKLLPNWHCMS